MKELKPQHPYPAEILLIDDNPADVELTTMVLKEGNVPCHISVAEDGNEALSRLRREGLHADAPRPDLILLDLNLPGKNGREILSELAQDTELCHIPVVIVTISETERNLLQTYNLAPNCYLVKPVDFHSFMSVIDSLGVLLPDATSAPLTSDSHASEETIRVLLLEDSPSDAELIGHDLATSRDITFVMEHVTHIADAMQRLDESRFDVIVLDLMIVQGDGLPASLLAFKEKASIPVVVLTGLDDERLGVLAVQAGAQDYVVKGRVDSDLLVRSLRYAVERSRRKFLEEQLYQSQRLEEIGRLAGGIAHDFNNLLTVILGHAQLAQTSDGDIASLQENVRFIEKAARSAASLTRQLLTFARKQIIQPEILDLNEQVQGMHHMLSRLITEDITLQLELHEGLERVKMDPGQIEQILVNLIVNARDAMPKGGEITIETSNIHLNRSEAAYHTILPGDYVQFAVRDTGEGMTAAVKAHIFEPFFTTKPNGKGTGLGMATCYGIVKQNNGAIAVDSTPGSGSTIHIYLPSVKDQSSHAVVQTSSSTSPGKEAILLVEDEPLVRDIAARTLREHGYQVMEATNGVEAITVASACAGRFQLLLTDVIMPQMGGKETGEKLQAMYPHIKILYMSGYTDSTIDRHGVLTPEAIILLKPFTPKSLANKVREVLDSFSLAETAFTAS